nr:immunoglobulin light chain junction region [Macaca mulatta]
CQVYDSSVNLFF